MRSVGIRRPVYVRVFLYWQQGFFIPCFASGVRALVSDLGFWRQTQSVALSDGGKNEACICEVSVEGDGVLDVPQNVPGCRWRRTCASIICRIIFRG